MVNKNTYHKKIKAHRVLLDNDKWYEYYQVMKVNVTEQKHVNALNNQQELRKILKYNEY